MKKAGEGTARRLRQYAGIAAAVLIYYLVHEGAHLAYALYAGAFKEVLILGPGMQVDIYADRMSSRQLGLFCLAGPAATQVCGWCLTAAAEGICRIKSGLLRSCGYYVTMAMLLLDPLYMSLLCSFFGGGDMNGVRLLMPEGAARALFGGLLIAGGAAFMRRILPVYTSSFRKENEAP
jgi:hypothetical protein